MGWRRRVLNFARRHGYNIAPVGDVSLLESLIYARHHPDFFFVQIGANDGKRSDPIHQMVLELGLKGIAVEPIREYFDALKRTYAGMPVTPVNAAIYKENGTVTLHRPIGDIPEWAHGIASLDPDHHKKSGLPAEMVSEEAEAVTFPTLLDRYAIESVDLLQIDAEGYDAEIIRMIPFSRIAPKIIHFEHGMSQGVMSREEFLNVSERLLTHRYKLITTEYDCIAYL